MKKLDGKDLLKMTQETYGTPNVTREQIGYVLSMLTPTNYLLKHHTIKGHPITFDVPNRDTNNAHSHRP